MLNDRYAGVPKPPATWTLAPLGELADFINGFPFKPSDWSRIGTPIIRIQNLNGGRDFNRFVGRIDDRYRVEPGDLLFSWSGNRGTSFGPSLWRGEAGLLNQHIFNVKDLRGAQKDFLFHVLRFLTSLIEREAHGGSGIVHIKKSELVRFKVPLPPLPEQRTIAAILSSVDNALERTQAVIDQVQVVKKGLMQELLTNGLPGRHTKFKQTEIGEVPEEWEVLCLGDILAGIDAGWSPVCEGRPASGDEWGVLKVSSVTSGRYLPEENKALTSQEPRDGIEVLAGDVLLARANGVLDLVGRAAFVFSTFPRLMLSDKTLRLRPVLNRIEPLFLTTLLNSRRIHAQVLKRTTGSHMRNVSQAALRSVLIPVPSLSEQAAITSIIRDTEHRRITEERLLGQLRRKRVTNTV